MTEQSIYNWCRQHLTDTGRMPGVSSTDHVELVAARKRIAELETELTVTRRVNELLTEVVPPNGGSVTHGCRVRVGGGPLVRLG